MKLYIEQIGEDKFQVTYGSRINIMSTNEVMALLSTKEEKKTEKSYQEQMEEFWASKPVYPRM